MSKNSRAAAAEELTQPAVTPTSVANLLKEKLKAIYRAQDTLPKLIEDPSIPEQRMDEYYVDLQMLVSNGSDKEPIESKDMFSDIGKSKAPSKVLIIGKAGVGKTTFLHHLSYEWGSDKAFADKFDYVFKVKLKKLLTEEARSVLLPLSEEEQLATLIQMSLKDQQAELKARFRTMSEEELVRSLERDHIDLAEKDTMLETVSSREIKEVLQEGKKGGSQAGKVALLLDGYDEISHLDVSGNVVSEIMQTIYDYQVVLTSRPNAVTGDREREFDRMIESTGLNNDGALTYIDTYYAKKQAIVEHALADFYEATPVAENKPASKLVSLMVGHFKKQKAENKEIFKVLKQIINEQGKHSVEESLSPSVSTSSSKSPTSKSSKALKSPKAVKTPKKVTKETISQEKFHEYIDKHYAEVKSALEKVLLSNASLQSVLTTPINTAMICLISDDPQVLAGLGDDINAGALYQEVIFWLAKRYTDKDIEAKARVKDLVKDGVFELPEVRVLKELACDEFKEGRVVIRGTDFEEHAREYLGNGGIREVNKFGLMRPENAGGNLTASSSDSMSTKDQGQEFDMDDLDLDEGLDVEDIDETDSDDLVHRDYAFIHLSFQEYLTAHLLKEHLSDDELYQDASQLIAHHRSEPRYLMTLKFLAGLVSTDTVSVVNEGSDQQELLALRFWDAVTCNVEGLLEFGLDTKVELFMHLLGQVSSRQMEQMLSRPEHSALSEKFKLMQELIDVVVLSDFNKWSEVVMASNYLSSNIAAVTKKIFQEQDPLAVVNKLGQMLSRGTEEVSTTEIEVLGTSLDAQIAKTASSLPDQPSGSISFKLQPLLTTILEDIEATSPLQVVRDRIQQLLSVDRQTERKDESKIATDYITDATSQTDTKTKEDSGAMVRASIRRVSANVTTRIPLEESNETKLETEETKGEIEAAINEQELRQAMEVVVTMSSKPEFDWKSDTQVVAGAEGSATSLASVSTREIIFRKLIERIKTCEQEGTEKHWQMQRVCFQKAQQVMDKSIGQEALIEALELVMEPRVQLVVEGSQPQQKQQTVKFFKLDPNLKGVTEVLVLDILKMAVSLKQRESSSSSAAMVEAPSQQLLDRYLQIINEVWVQCSDLEMKKLATNALGEFFKVIKSYSEMLSSVRQALGIIHEWAKDSNEGVKESAVNALAKFFEVMKAPPVWLASDSVIMQQAFGIIQELAHAEDWKAKESAVNAIVAFFEVMKTSPEILSSGLELVQQAFGVIQGLAKTKGDGGWNDKSNEVRESAVNALGAYMQVMKSSPDLLLSSDYPQQAFGIIQELAKDSGLNVRKSAGKTLVIFFEVMKDSPNRAFYLDQAFDFINSWAKGSSGADRQSAVNALEAFFEIMKDYPDRAFYLAQAFDFINAWAKDSNEGGKESAVNALAKFFEVMKNSPELAFYLAQALEIINFWSMEKDTRSERSAALAIFKFFKIMEDSPELVQAFDLINLWAKDSEWGVRKSAGNAVREYMQVMKDLPVLLVSDYTQQAFKIIKSLAKDTEDDPYGQVRESAGEALREFFEVTMKASPDLLLSSDYLQQAFDIIQESVYDESENSWRIKRLAVMALEMFFQAIKSSPEVLSSYLQQAFDIIQDFVKDSDDGVKTFVADALGEFLKVMKASPDLLLSSDYLQQVFDIIQEVAKYRDSDVRESAGKALGEFLKVMKASPDLLLSSDYLQRAFNIIQELARDDSVRVKFSAVNALGEFFELIKSSPEILSSGSELVQQAFGIIQEVAKDDNAATKYSAVNALGEFFELIKFSPKILSSDSGTFAEAFDIIQELAKNSDYRVRESAGEVLAKFLEIMKSSFQLLSTYAERVFSLIEELARDNSSDEDSCQVRQSAANALGGYMQIMQASPELTAYLGKALEIISSLMREKEMDVREAAGNALAKFFAVMKESPVLLDSDSEIVQQTFGIIQELGKDGVLYVRESAGKVLVKFFEVMKDSPVLLASDSGIAQQAFGIIPEWVKDSNYHVRVSAGEVLAKFLEVMKDSPVLLASDSGIVQQAFSIIQELGKDDNPRLQYSAVNALAKFFEVIKFSPEIVSPELLQQAFGIIQVLAKYDHWQPKQSAVNAVKAMPLEFIIELDLLHHSDALIRNAAIESIPAKCAELEEEFSMESTVAADFVNSHIDLIRVMLSVIGYESKDDEDHVKSAAASAKNFLELMVNNVTEEMQGWASDNFEDLLRERISSETPAFFKAMLHKALGDGEISDLDREFIIKCIQAGFTTSFTADGKIIFEGRVYDLARNVTDVESVDEDRAEEIVRNNKLALDAIIETAMSQDQDLLSHQYRGHDPLFPTHDHSLTKPASDFVVARSLAGGARVVHSDKVIVTLVQPVSESGAELDDSSQQFILLERRDAFGSLVLDKITADGTVESIILHPDVMVHRPEAGNAALKQLILGLDAKSKPADVLVKYQAATMVVSVDEGRKLLKAARKVQEDAGEVKEADASDVGHSKDSGDSFGALFAILKKSIGEEKVAEHELGRSWDHEVAVHQLIAMELSQEMLQIDSLGRRVDKLDAEFADSVFRDADILQHMIEDHKFAKAEKAEIASISANSYQDAFYKTLRMELNSSYLAATTIKSGWVQNNKKGDMGKFGSFMKEVSGVVPFVGPGVKIIGSVLKMADAKHQKSMIDNYATFVVDSAEMAQVAELIARMVVLSNLAIKKKDQSIQSKIKGWLANAADKFSTGDLKLLPEDLDEAVSMVQDKVITTVQDKISEATDLQGQAEEAFAAKKAELMEQAASKLAGIKAANAAAAKGTADAKIVAQMIAGKIFTGEFKVGDLHAKAAGISEFIGGEFETMDTAVDVTAVAEEKTDTSTPVTSKTKLKTEVKKAEEKAEEPTITEVKVKGTSLDQPMTATTVSTQEELAKDVAISALDTLKTLLDADDLVSVSTKREEKFVKDLADSLASVHNGLLESAKINSASKNKVVKQIASRLEKSEIASVSDEQFALSNQFVREDDFFDKVLSSQLTTTPAPAPGGCCTVSYLTRSSYGEEILNHPEVLKVAANRDIALDQLIELCSDPDVFEIIIASTKEQRIEQMLDLLFGDHNAEEKGAGDAVECAERDISETLLGGVVYPEDGFFAS